ncbi:MAG: translation initiation factor 2 [Clostridia bacterium]|jgi:hydroxymethylpyrimidine pyrophosphatase-like HAD family hydrolase|nr:translation initiation factor 2 [Clostridia bacterium]MDD4572280.1 translation initiation factor 2 [Clostridia bacterium]
MEQKLMENGREIFWRERVNTLEERLEQMRLSRRVLLRILEQAELERKIQVAELTRSNKELKRHNACYIASIMEKNKRIIALQDEGVEY